ncbi:MAG: hypothetical protein R2838_06015 [Caldilineaceae bacterium]
MAIGAVSQVTPLRLTYLNRIWESYRNKYGAPMPVDIWTMHAYVLARNWATGAWASRRASST